MNGRKTIENLKSNFSQDLENRVVEHRNRFLNLIIYRYKELLPYLIQYENVEKTAINQVKLEHALRNNYNIVVGKAKNGKIMILGYIQKLHNYKYDFYDSYRHTGKDINFTIPKHLRPGDDILEIQEYDDCQSGDFIILQNKNVSYVNDNVILEHYAIELAEISLSRFSLIMQSKINTIFVGQNNDESLNQLVNKIYNGSPFIKVSRHLDLEESHLTLENAGMSQAFNELKQEYQHKISELNNMLGINSLAVEKASGVSETEAKSNRGYTTSNANIYINSRQNEIDKLNKRFGLDIIVTYNDEVRSELQSLGSDINDIQYNDIQYPTK